MKKKNTEDQILDQVDNAIESFIKLIHGNKANSMEDAISLIKEWIRDNEELTPYLLMGAMGAIASLDEKLSQ